MWYEEIVCQLNREAEYTRQQLYDVLVKEKLELTFNSFKWIISEMIDKVDHSGARHYKLLQNGINKNDRASWVFYNASVAI